MHQSALIYLDTWIYENVSMANTVLIWLLHGCFNRKPNLIVAHNGIWPKMKKTLMPICPYAHVATYPITPPLLLYLSCVTLKTTPGYTLHILIMSITLLDYISPKRPLPCCPYPPTLLSFSSVYRHILIFLN